jgi:hypothetical protein
MYDAEDAWLAKDLPRARRCFQRILHVRPTHQAANERMAELFFIDGLQADGAFVSAREDRRFGSPNAMGATSGRSHHSALLNLSLVRGRRTASRLRSMPRSPETVTSMSSGRTEGTYVD